MCKDRICPYMVLYAPLDLIRYANYYFQKKKCFDLLTPYGGEGIRKDIICACMVVDVPFPLI